MSTLLKLDGFLALIIDKAFILSVTISILFFIYHLGWKGFTRQIHKYSVDKDNPQLATLLTIMRSAWKYLLLIIGMISVLNICGLKITANSLLAAAGAGGLILGIGAQDFIKDILNGFTIILENQYSVGDYIEIGDLCGTVVNMSLRTTRIVGDNQETISIPNSAISSVVNYSKRPPIVMCYLTLADEKQLPLAIAALKKMVPTFSSQYAADKAHFMGVTNVHPYGVEVGVSCLCKVGHRLDLKYCVYEAMSLALIEAGVTISSGNVSVTEEVE